MQGHEGSRARGASSKRPTSSSPRTGNRDVITVDHMAADEAPGDRREPSATSTTRSRWPRSRRSTAIERNQHQAAGRRVALPRRPLDSSCSRRGACLNLGNATGHPSFVMSNSFTNQVIAQIELFGKAGRLRQRRVHVLPKHLDEEGRSPAPRCPRRRAHPAGARAGRLHRRSPVEGPYKSDHYRY